MSARQFTLGLVLIATGALGLTGCGAIFGAYTLLTSTDGGTSAISTR